MKEVPAANNIKAKADEVKTKLEQITAEKTRLQTEILNFSSSASGAAKGSSGDDYSWQQGSGDTSSRYSIVYVLIVAIISLYIGRYMTESGNTPASQI